MAPLQPIPLIPTPTGPQESEFRTLLSWPFAEQLFYEKQIKRVLERDVPHRVAYSFCQVWLYQDPAGNTVGFGTLDLCKEYEDFTDGKYHCYIPVLGVNPGFRSRGHGRSIVEHLIAESVLIARSSTDFSDLIFLDVYTANHAAISLYEKCGFVALNADNPILDPEENNEPFIIMAKRVSIAASQ